MTPATIRDTPGTSLTVVDTIKAVASQVIVLHHLAFYGLLSNAVEPHAPAVLDWLSEYGRIAVQCFLVVGGFLAARSLMPSLGATWRPIGASSLPPLLWKRYVRLMRPYLVALLMAVAAAWLARWLVADPDIPQAPTLAQLGWHLLLLQDLMESPALSAGVWYVAIDMQLYALMAVCFFGAYGLGVAAHWVSNGRYREMGAAVLAGLVLRTALSKSLGVQAAPSGSSRPQPTPDSTRRRRPTAWKWPLPDS
jgi:hypothetical protein